MSHLTHAIPLSLVPPPQRKFICILVMLLRTTFGILKKDEKKIGSEDRTYLRRVILPTKEINMRFQVKSFPNNLSKIGFHQDALF